MVKIGLIKEGKLPKDNRVALTPLQCRFVENSYPEVKIIVQHSEDRCYADKEYLKEGIIVKQSLEDCDIILGIKEIPVQMLIPFKTYYFFSHTKKLQPRNRLLLQEIIKNNITLIDYECLEHSDGTRIMGFGFFAGIVGAHNGMMAYGKKTGHFFLDRVDPKKDLRHLIHTYFGLKLPEIKIAVTGTGRVAHGILEVMNLLDIHEVEPDEYKEKDFTYPVYVHLKGADLYQHNTTGSYNRNHFHENPSEYHSRFKSYLICTDILMNGVYWEEDIPRLFEMNDIGSANFKIKTIADISDDHNGSIPCNTGDGSVDNPVYGIDLDTLKVTAPYLKNTVDIMAVGNLPNELPRDASQYFGEQIIKELIEGMISGNSPEIENATIVKHGKLTTRFEYMKEYGKY